MFLLGNINNNIRLNLFLNYLLNRLKLLFLGDRPNRGLEGKKVFFITGYGRSGTMFLYSVLNKIPKVQVEHEPLGYIDLYAVVKSFYGELNLPNYYRLKLQYINRVVKNDADVYGEVNGCLRHHIGEIGELFNAKIGYVLRDGRDVVRSMMNRAVYTQNIDPLRTYPKKTDRFYKEFQRMVRFEKCCWAWAMETERALSRIRDKAADCKFLRFEEFTEDIRALYDICNYFEIKHGKQYIGEKDLNKKINVSPSNAFPRYDQWTKTQREQFNRIAGEVNISIGYALS